ncbi:thiamine phosphate synthase [Staphylococcus delphini]|uniref:Thiamine phosphate synthase n=1 Tax=Staphylococcus delphini TaxID=53344 RepID=A0AAP8AZX5_9STAP|nr:thiamine phosphate synthase [Staphylococcus delphini]MDE9752399.1 thiamine phosphate synthase [Staphylococcus delphini]MDE9789331.1 thiamine phosphate synthase [Staphylococcus delphini]MDE9791531.1 thiamine phosphate synthase [Staphylococcus delphini]MDE9793885.1 thiamine phosphate synthase [Staphylococcus delphini]MDE9796226.1 thiamine phosphate synthase [Staphylococcus delphini]
MIIVITPYVVLDDWHIKRLCVIENRIAGVIIRTPMNRHALKQWLIRLLANDFPKSKVIIHTDIALAAELGISNVHFKEGDQRAASLKQAHPHYQVSMSTHSAAMVRNAKAQQLDFVLFGHLFPTSSKPDLPPRTQLEMDEVLAIDFPVVALGGITADTVQQISSHFTGIACISSAFGHKLQQFEKMIDNWSLKKVK